MCIRDRSKDAAVADTEFKAKDRTNRPQRAKAAMTADEVFKMDKDGDDLLSKSEVTGPLAKRFDQIDTNGDEKISRKEFENAPKPERGQRRGKRGGR